jgi:hypothetical protein
LIHCLYGGNNAYQCRNAQGNNGNRDPAPEPVATNGSEGKRKNISRAHASAEDKREERT